MSVVIRLPTYLMGKQSREHSYMYLHVSVHLSLHSVRSISASKFTGSKSAGICVSIPLPRRSSERSTTSSPTRGECSVWPPAAGGSPHRFKSEDEQEQGRVPAVCGGRINSEE